MNKFLILKYFNFITCFPENIKLLLKRELAWLLRLPWVVVSKDGNDIVECDDAFNSNKEEMTFLNKRFTRFV